VGAGSLDNAFGVNDEPQKQPGGGTARQAAMRESA